MSSSVALKVTQIGNSVGVNNTVARALGLELPTAESLMRELHRVEASAP